MSAQLGESSSNAGSVHLQGERLGSVISISLQPNSRHGLNGKIVRAKPGIWICGQSCALGAAGAFYGPPVR
jgi:hypothetical protein